MRAAVHTRYGGPEVVRVSDVDEPSTGPGDVLVRVLATTVNRTDCGFRAAKPFTARLFTGLVKPKVTILGCEFAGRVEAVGSAVTSFAVGDDVFGYNEGPFGTHAEYLSIPQNGSITTMPPSLDYEHAAAGTEGSHYALGFIRRAGIGSGHRVLVNGATGAIGSAAVQLAVALGARVTAVCDTDRIELVETLGPERIIDYTVDDFTAGDDSYDVVLDAVGKSSFARCRPVLEPGGSYLSTELGALGQNPILAVVTKLFGGRLSGGRLFKGRRVFFPIPTHDKVMIKHLRDLMADGRFSPVIDRRYQLEQIVDAYRYVEAGEKTGNVIITLSDDDTASG